MNNLESIYSNLNFGDIILFQTEKNLNPILVTVVFINIIDMALSIGYINYKNFILPYFYNKDVEIEEFIEWDDEMIVLGYWKSIPDFKSLLKAYRKKVEN